MPSHTRAGPDAADAADHQAGPLPDRGEWRPRGFQSERSGFRHRVLARGQVLPTMFARPLMSQRGAGAPPVIPRRCRCALRSHAAGTPSRARRTQRPPSPRAPCCPRPLQRAAASPSPSPSRTTPAPLRLAGSGGAAGAPRGGSARGRGSLSCCVFPAKQANSRGCFGDQLHGRRSAKLCFQVRSPSLRVAPRGRALRRSGASPREARLCRAMPAMPPRFVSQRPARQPRETDENALADESVKWVWERKAKFHASTTSTATPRHRLGSAVTGHYCSYISIQW